MKKKLLSILLSIVMIVGIMPLVPFTAFAEEGEVSPVYVTTYFRVWPDASIDFDDAVTVSGKTLYVETSKLVRISPKVKDVRIIIRSNATVFISGDYCNNEMNNDSYAPVTVQQGKTAYINFDDNMTVSSTSASALVNNGTLTIEGDGLKFISDGASAIGGSGKLTVNVPTMTAKGNNGAGIQQKSVTVTNCKLTAAGSGSYAGIDSADISISNSTVTAKGEADAAGIGGSSGKSFDNIEILNSVVTANGGVCGIGAGTNGTQGKIVIDSDSSVKGTLGTGAVDPDGNTVTLHEISNPDGRDIILDGSVFKRRYHGSEKALFLYMTEEEHEIKFADTITIKPFKIIPDCDDFPFGDIIYDEENHKLTVKTEKPFTIRNNDPSKAVSDSIIISSSLGANITFDGVNIRAADGTPALELDPENCSDVTITLAAGSTNRLIGGYGAHGIRNPLGHYSEFFNPYNREPTDPLPGLTICGGGYLYVVGADNSAIGDEERTGQINILSGAVTFQGGYKSLAIGGGKCDDYRNMFVVVGENASLKYIDGEHSSLYYPDEPYDASLEFCNEEGKFVYPLTVSNPDGKTVVFDGKELPVSSHGDDGCLYLYRSKDNAHFSCIGNELKAYKFDFEEKSFEASAASMSTGAYTVTGGSPGTDYAYYHDTLYFFPDGNKTFIIENTDKTKAAEDTVFICKDRSMKLVLAGVKINGTIKIAEYSKGDITIELSDGTQNTVDAGGYGSGIEKISNADSGTLTITGKGSLNVKGNEDSAAIGGSYYGSTANIVINGGVITAQTTNVAAAIGGGYKGSAENIIINGGSVTAVSKNGAAIGGGFESKGTHIEINGGEVTAVSPLDSAIGFGEGEWSEEDLAEHPLISPDASVKTNSKNEYIRNEYDERVYAVKIDNENGSDISVDSVKLACKKHFDEKAVYVYLTGADHIVTAGEKNYGYYFDESTLTFTKRLLHDHVFSTAWTFDEAHHWHPCTVEGCDHTVAELAAETACGYAEHEFTDFVCVCGYEDTENCRAFYSDMIRGIMAGGSTCAKIKNDALEALQDAKTVTEITGIYEACVNSIDEALKNITAAANAAVEEINNTLDGYTELLENEHGYVVTALKNKADAGLLKISTASSVELVSGVLENTLAEMKTEALGIARMNTCLEIDLALLNAESPSQSVIMTAKTAKTAINAADSLKEIFEIAEWAEEMIAELGGEEHEHTFSDSYTFNEIAHWHAATCVHTDVIIGYGEHTFDEGAASGNTTTYTCTVCGYEKTETAPAEKEPCPKCGGTHADNLFGRIICLFNRLINSIKKLFG